MQARAHLELPPSRPPELQAREDYRVEDPSLHLPADELDKDIVPSCSISGQLHVHEDDATDKPDEGEDQLRTNGTFAKTFAAALDDIILTLDALTGRRDAKERVVHALQQPADGEVEQPNMSSRIGIGWAV